MIRYTTRPRAAWDDEVSETARQLIEQEDAPEKTGLLDQHGRPLYRVRESVPFGFRMR